MVTTVNQTTVWGVLNAGSPIQLPNPFGEQFAVWFDSLPTIDPLTGPGTYWNNGGTVAESELAV